MSTVMIPVRAGLRRIPVSAKTRLGRTVVFVMLCVIGASTVYPLLFMALNSFRTNPAYQLNPFGLPRSFDTSNFVQLFSQFPIASAFLHSMIVVIPADIITTLFAALAAFVFTKTPFRGSAIMFYGMLMVMLMPGVVLLIPLYVMIVHVGLAGSFVPAILIYASVNIPFGTYLLRANFRGIPNEMVEAARVDGAGWGRVFRSVVLRVGLPGVITVAIMTFLGTWNDLFMSIVLLHTPGTEMLTPTLTELPGRYTTDLPVLLAGLLVAALPTVVIYLFASRVFVRGLTGSFR